ncbi:MAG: 3-deoxy-7-phosphoheptulonate synthase [Clostridiales bacterium]|jgi:3-deoxy-7-phosphoheptulonate synthase|nr:3-deoxy-7-phosphoheptulonate synthase [Clostridiales bacterium]
MDFKRKLPIPLEVKSQYPLSAGLRKRKKERDIEIKSILSGESDKFLLIIGPCSADNEISALDYVLRLAKIQEQVYEKILIIPRVYTSKPRTTGVGYKGMLHQPDPFKGDDMLAGLVSVRRLHIKIMEETGLSCSDEMLYPENFRYFSDILSYVAIGARSAENQQHRLVASGLDMPVGMKNPVSGNMSTLINSISAAQSGHMFIYRGWEVASDGNPFAHAILRGMTDDFGHSVPNYHYEEVMRLSALYDKADLANKTVIIDVNHSNSAKRHLEQPRICKEILTNRAISPEHRNFVKGVMVESYIEDGNQPTTGAVYGKSITDPCLGWDKSERLMFEMAESF